MLKRILSHGTVSSIPFVCLRCRLLRALYASSLPIVASFHTSSSPQKSKTKIYAARGKEKRKSGKLNLEGVPKVLQRNINKKTTQSKLRRAVARRKRRITAGKLKPEPNELPKHEKQKLPPHLSLSARHTVGPATEEAAVDRGKIGPNRLKLGGITRSSPPSTCTTLTDSLQSSRVTDRKSSACLMVLTEFFSSTLQSSPNHPQKLPH